MAKKILIIGAVALGTKAATRCKRLNPDTEITLIDQGQFISYGGCGMPYYISSEVDSIDDLRATSANVIRDPKFFTEVKDIDCVKIRTQAKEINRQEKYVLTENLDTGEQEKLYYDELVLGMGSHPVIPNIKGVHLKNVTTVAGLEDAAAIRGHCTKGVGNMVIIGASFTAIEIAVGLAEMWGINCTLIKRSKRMLPNLVSSTVSDMIKYDLEQSGISIIAEEDVLEFADDGSGNVCEVVTDKQRIKADHVILAMGVKPNYELAEKAGLKCSPKYGVCVNEYLQTSDPCIYAGGDLIAVKNLISGQETNLPMGSLANRQGRIIGTNIAGGNPVTGLETFPGVVGTWCMKMGKGSVAGTGLNLDTALKAGFDAVSISMEQLDRAHFYPEKSMMTLEVVADRKTRRILGMQGYCADGTALKARIDTMAAMLQFGKPDLHDLSVAEVSYSPPFASAMDVFNTAGNVADNILTGLADCITPEEFDEIFENRESNNYIIVDARPGLLPFESARKNPDYWLAMPLETFNQDMQNIPKDKKIALICNSGTRAYECQLKLKKKGIYSVNASGGIQAMKKRGKNY